MNRANEGDIFEVKTESNKLKYFQFIGTDMSQLNSEVIRVFNSNYDARPLLETIINDQIDFHVHVVIKFGIKLGLWEKIGVEAVADKATYFKESLDYGNQKVSISKNWRVWKINEPFRHVRELNEEQENYDLGLIVNPMGVYNRISNGSFNIQYPKSRLR